MSLYGSAVEYGLHCLLHLVDGPSEGPPSSRDVAEFQGVSPSYVAKLFTRLEKAGLITSTEGVGGGFRLARPAERISVLEVADKTPARMRTAKERWFDRRRAGRRRRTTVNEQ